MPWSSKWPPKKLQDIQNWDFLSEPFRAFRDVQSILSGSMEWPHSAQPWGGGTVVSVTQPDPTNTDLVVDFGPVDWSPLPNGCSSPRWVNMVCSDCHRNFIPATYDLVIETPDRDDPWQTVRGLVTAQTWSGSPGSNGKLTIDGTMVLNWITGKIVPSLSALAGRKIVLVRSGAEANATPTERMPYKPNEQAAWVGYVSDSGAVEIALGDDDSSNPPTYSYLTDKKGKWTDDQWVDQSDEEEASSEEPQDFELLAYDSDGLLHRVEILHNDDRTLYFEEASWTVSPGSKFNVMPKGNKAVPGRAVWRPHRWYSGLPRGMYGHKPDDSIGLSPQPTNSYFWDDGDACSSNAGESASCVSVDHLAFDNDIWINYDNTCEPGRAGSVAVKDYYSTWRSLQTGVVGICGAFVPRNADRPYNFTPALLFWTCGINSGSGSLSVDGTTWSFTVDQKYKSTGIYWTVMRHGMPYASGDNSADVNGKVVVGGSFTVHHNDGSDPDSDVGLEVRYSAGYTRYYPEWFNYSQGRRCFIPSTVTALNGAVSVIDPPQVPHNVDPNTGAELPSYDCSKRGGWEQRPKSVSPVQGALAFEVGHYYRLVGDNFNDPGITPQTEPSNYSNALVHYWNHFYRGKLNPQNQGQWNSQKAGTVSKATSLSVTASDVDWGVSWCDGSFVQTVTDTIDETSALVPYVPADKTTTPTTPEVLGSVTVSANAPVLPCASSWVVKDADGKNVLAGTYGFTANGSQVVPGEFTADMVGDPKHTITFTFHGGLHVESGTASSGTTTTLSDSAKDCADPDKPFGCWWAASAFHGLPPYTDFVLTITKADDGTVYKTPIVSTTTGSSGVTITFKAVDGLTVEAGDGYEIVESAYTVNRWQDCLLRVTDKAGNEYTTTITHSDNDTLVYEAGSLKDEDGNPIPTQDESDQDGTNNPQAGWTFAIEELVYGGVYKWDGSKMVTTAGLSDSVRIGVPSDPEDFHDNLVENLEGFKVGYGVVEKGDVISMTMFKELYWTLNALKNTLQGINWTPQRTPDGQEITDAEALGFEDVESIYETYDWGPVAEYYETPANYPLLTPDGCGPGVPGWFLGYHSSDIAGACQDATMDASAAIKKHVELGCDTDGYQQMACYGGNPSGHGAVWHYASCSAEPFGDFGPPTKGAFINAKEETTGDYFTGDCRWVGQIDGQMDLYVARRYGYTTVAPNPYHSVQGVDFWNWGEGGRDGKKDVESVFTKTSNSLYGSGDNSEANPLVLTCTGSGEYHFLNGGDPVQWHDWTMWSTGGAPDSDGKVFSDWLGSMTLIQFPVLKMPCERVCWNVNGFYTDFYNTNAGLGGYTIGDGKSVVKWSKNYDGPWNGSDSTETQPVTSLPPTEPTP